MFNGASAALKKSPRLQRLLETLDIQGFDDAADPSNSVQIADSLRRDPRIIAVIGHATSESTRAAVQLYHSVGIPLVMPIATSPSVMLSKEAVPTRFDNAFRLPPADDIAQAPAIAYLLLNKLNSQRIALIQDETPGAVGYSDPLTNALRPYITNHVVYSGYADRLNPNFVELASSTHSNHPDTVVFCGYGTTAIELLSALRSVYAPEPESSRPRVVLSDGCLVPDLNTSHFETFLTFPHIAVRSAITPADSADITNLHTVFGRIANLGYELFGYDAMLIIGEAALSCAKEGISRECLTHRLHRPDGFLGMGGLYRFDAGENVLSSYDVLKGSPLDALAFSPTGKDIIDASTLAAVRSGRAVPP
jgi:ABC-type branched-subunit amino acid transport system substrate-binding protein